MQTLNFRKTHKSRSVGWKGSRHSRCESLEKACDSVCPHDGSRTVGEALVGSGWCRLQARFHDVRWDSNGPHSYPSTSSCNNDCSHVWCFRFRVALLRLRKFFLHGSIREKVASGASQMLTPSHEHPRTLQSQARLSLW